MTFPVPGIDFSSDTSHGSPKFYRGYVGMSSIEVRQDLVHRGMQVPPVFVSTRVRLLNAGQSDHRRAQLR